MIKKNENNTGWHDASMTVEELINQLKEYNPKAIVKLHFTTPMEENKGNGNYFIGDRVASTVTGHSFENDMDWDDNIVWITSKGLI